MKKSKAAADQPVGIVIAAGATATAVNSPRVRAYFWCDIETSDVSRTEDE
jgi:hypothetical protein